MPRTETTSSRATKRMHSAPSWVPLLTGAALGAWGLVCFVVVSIVISHWTDTHHGCKTSDQPACAEQVTALNKTAAAIVQLTDGIAETTTALKSLRGAGELATVHRRLSDMELLVRWSTEGCRLKCPSLNDKTKCDERDGNPKQDTSFDTIGPCVRREKIGHIQFHPGFVEYLDDQQAKVSSIAKQIAGELRHVFAVGYADDSVFTRKNVRVGLERARFVADALLQELGGDACVSVKPDNIRAVSGLEWVPATSRSPSQHGTVEVYLLWQGISPLCNAGQSVGMGIP